MGSNRFWRGFTWALFFAAMSLYGAFLTWGDQWGWWFTGPLLCILFAIGYVLDKRAGRL